MNARHWDASECAVVLTDYQDHICVRAGNAKRP
jgi:hypothetical protein